MKAGNTEELNGVAVLNPGTGMGPGLLNGRRRLAKRRLSAMVGCHCSPVVLTHLGTEAVEGSIVYGTQNIIDQ